MKDILLLTDYKGFFGSKQKTKIYRSGMDIVKMARLFQEHEYNIKIVNFSQLDLDIVFKTRPIVLYTSSEDNYGMYKAYIEDIIFALEQKGIFVLPKYKYLKAHNNKVFMECLREISEFTPIKTIHSKFFGSYEELILNLSSFIYPVVIKPAYGAMSKGVAKALNEIELIKSVKAISASKSIIHDIKELLREIKHKGYIKESTYRNKFIVQNFIPGLNNDWKVLLYDNKCYVLYRGNRENDFRASGSGKFEFRKELPAGLLDFAYSIKTYFDVPHISLDIGYDGKTFHLIEFQFLYFGTTTLEKSSFYFEKSKDNWRICDEQSDIEFVYVESIINYLKKEEN
ncbi:MAG: hypothetical protein JXB49_36655 [Bacteroidales bacterium]|nr:hypothetical protein [Bacteroidales bacterium]